MRLLFFGTPEFAVPAFRSLISADHEVAAVVTQPDRAKGRGHALSEPPVKIAAKECGIPVFQPERIRTDEFADTVASFSPDAVIVVAYGRIIPARILDIPARGCINVHASLLPKYRGAAPIQWAIIRGEEKTGITTMQMDEGLDTGGILLMDETLISDDDTAETLACRLSVMGASLLLKTLDGIGSGSIAARPQEGEASYAPILKKEDGRIVWSRSAREIFNLMRGTYPWPGAFTYLGSERITLLKTRARAGSGESGRIERIVGDDIIVGTGQGLLAIAELKPDGKRAMPAAAFARGRGLQEGDRFEEGI